jgi:valyl-tRNA synthetase
MPDLEMPKTYDFESTEERLYQWWWKSGWFKPEIAGPEAEPFVISIPPPNVTGELHIGHAMFVTIEDLMIRHARMKGYAALWMPGYDHAGIATQLQVEKMLRDEGTSRQAIGREEFFRRVWDWMVNYSDRIIGQLRRLGASCDWDRMRFTVDPGLSRAVREAFVRLYEMGLIYRGEYLINWSPGLQTAVSDLEVEYTEEDTTLYYFKYPIAGKPNEYIPVATIRPETILGDTAVAVHPDDERYRHYIGATCLVPILNRPIPVIHDTYVDMDFGTGALKITPGHDPADFEIGQRHGLPIVNVLSSDATMNANAGPYAGLDRFECRKRLWADMEKAGLTIKTEPYHTTLPRSQRGGEIVEPMVSTQWFVRMKPLAELGLEAVRSDRIKIVPERFTKVYYNWLENIRDWCISRQLWWGHRIPVWYCADCGQMFAAREDPDHCVFCKSSQIEQDPDVLDTWFSSALWPFSTLGWPDDTPDLRRYYPTDVMETGYDILFFWVARMIMTGLTFTNNVPFHTVYLHGLVRDDQGRKMSKTTGNVIDPLYVIDGAHPEQLGAYVRQQYPNGLPAMGTDALRFTLLTSGTPGNDLNLSLQRVEANRNFANKIWNAARFVVMNLEGGDWTLEKGSPSLTSNLQLADRWIVSRLNTLVANANRLFDAHQYGEAGRQMYEFLWGDYCDWYLEIAKLQLARDGVTADTTRSTLVHVLDQSLRLLHPFIPFVTEEIWQHLKQAVGATTSLRSVQALGGRPAWPEALMIARWPEVDEALIDPQAEADMSLVMDLIRTIRNARAEYNVEPGRRIPAIIASGQAFDLIQQQLSSIAALARLDPARLSNQPAATPPAQAVALVVGGVACYLPLAGLVDLEKERQRLSKELASVVENIARSEKLLADEKFTGRAPAAVVQKERDKLADLQARRDRLEEQLAAL